MSADIQIISVIGANGQPLPIHGNSIGSNWAAPVKQERADEAEIQELAAKMMENQKAALAKQQAQAAQVASRQSMQANGMQNTLPNTNGQTTILNYLSRQKLPNGTNPLPNGAPATNGRSNSVTSVASNGDDKKAPCDEESQKGHFGWTTFGKVYIPYIYRQQEKYCSVRMIELKLLAKYLNCLHPDIYSSCTCVRSYYITDAEARLLIEINHKHCDGEFGRDMFTPKDLVVRLSDATKFYQFLDICYRKLISGSKSPSERCGFIRINKESVVPYTVRNNEQVVPLFYFEGETENLKQKADYLSGWDLAYLKFCCKVQGIRNELFSSENVAVISLTDIKSYFPNGTEFEDYWPSKVVDSNLLIGNRANANNSVNWTRQPAQPPPKVMSQPNMSKNNVHSAAANAAQAQQQQLLKRGNAANAFAAQSAAAAAAAMQQPNQRMHSNAALNNVQQQALTNGSWMQQNQNNLPLIHAQMLASQAQQNAANSRAQQQYRNPMESLMMGNRQQYTYNNAAISMQPVTNHNQGNPPPPLVRSAGQQNANHMSNVEQAMLQHATQQQQRHSSLSLSLASPAANNAIPPPATNSSSFNFNLPSSNTTTNYTNALWEQLTPEQRLFVTQQIKSNGSLHSKAAPAFTHFPGLPLDTELITMLDYNAAKSKPSPTGMSMSMCSTTITKSNGQFTKPSVPPLIPGTTLEPSSKRCTNYATGYAAPPHAGGSVPLNSAHALEDFEKKFKMTDEMKAVVQKVLSNPDLSTFIQTNSSNNFVPFISPPVSPAGGLLSSPATVTITPQLPNGRLKSVICSTTTGTLNVPPSPSTSNSTATPSPSPTRSHPNSAGQKTNHYRHSTSSPLTHHLLNSPTTPTTSSLLFQQQQQQLQQQQQNTPPMDVIDLSSPRRSLQAASAYIQQQQQQVHQAAIAAAAQQQHQQRLAAAAQHHSQQNGRSSASSASANSSNSASMHLQRHAAMAAQQSAAAGVGSENRLSIIPELPAGSQMHPYKLQKVFVNAQLVSCINMKAYNESDQLMTLTDFQKYFFSHTPLEHCKRLIEALGVELYKGNRRQNQILMENDRNHNENIPLVQVKDVIKYMTQLTFMIRNQEQPPSKRTRIS